MIKAIVTGHTRGIGACLTAELLSRGAILLSIARRRNVELELRYGPKLDHIELDLSSLHEAQQWIASDALLHFLSGSETVLLINNVATAQPLGAAPDLDIHSISKTISLNITVPIMLASAVMASGATASDKRILHLSSGASRSAYPGLCVHGTTKAAFDHHAMSALNSSRHRRNNCYAHPNNQYAINRIIALIMAASLPMGNLSLPYGS